jgi:hypothetical protein
MIALYVVTLILLQVWYSVIVCYVLLCLFCKFVFVACAKSGIIGVSVHQKY